MQHDIILCSVFLLAVTALVRPVGRYLALVFERERTPLDRLLLPLERLIHRVAGSDPMEEMTWGGYARSMITFAGVGTVVLYAILRLQRFLPWSGHVSSSMTPDLAMNTAISFATTTTWQAYAGEGVSHAAQLGGLMFQNFVAGAAGLAAGIAFIRGLAREKSHTIGNFWGDLVRSLLWVLLPASLLVAVALMICGVPMTFDQSAQAITLEGARQIIARGPIAAFESIKNLGTNGGGFLNANGAHPFEAPSPAANLIHMLSIAVIPAAMTFTFGMMTRRKRQGWFLYGVMVALFAGAFTLCAAMEHRGIAGGMEGKEVRFGIGDSALGAVVTSNDATGSYNAMVDSFSPIGGAVPLMNMLLGEIVFGGLGTGLVSILLGALLGVFVGGLMVGRSPEFLGKVIGPRETKMIMLYTIIGPFAVLVPTALAVVTRWGLAGLTTNDGAHGLTEILFAFASSFGNNGQNMAGLNANSPFYNIATAVAMMLGRFGLLVPALALAGSFAAQKRRPETAGTLRTDTALFSLLLVVVIFVVGGLTYFPVLSLGPIAEAMTR
jgi:K+-transporting ATPase ATPase A chain